MTGTCNADTWLTGVILCCIGVTLLLTNCFIQRIAIHFQQAVIREERKMTRNKLKSVQIEDVVSVNERGLPFAMKGQSRLRM